MNIKIKNDFLAVEISTLGAEIQSIKSIDGTEFIWCGDESVWSGKAPVLFPICGALDGGTYEYSGTEYTLAKHGFARLKEFECVRCEDSEAEFVLKHDDETLKSYPFKFTFCIVYTLKGNVLEVTYKVDNESDETMYFSLGAHEAYACPEGINKYRVTFESDDEIALYRADENGLIIDKKLPFPLENKSFMLDKNMFTDDALVFPELKSRRVYLENAETGKKITVDFEGFGYLLIWTKPEGDYICIEPWTGIPDTVRCTGKLSQKEGITALEKSCDYIIKHNIKFEK